MNNMMKKVVFNMTNHDEMNEQHKENQNEDLSKIKAMFYRKEI